MGALRKPQRWTEEEDRAIEGVTRLDFVKACRLKDYLRDEDGNTYDYQIMMKTLQQQWSDF